MSVKRVETPADTAEVNLELGVGDRPVADSSDQKELIIPGAWWRRIAEAGEQIPAEERARIPVDASENLDHYLYGWPKRDVA